MVKAAYELNGPVYIRFGRAATPVYHSEDYRFEIGKGEVIRDGTDAAIIATVEEHTILGGLGEAVCGVLSEKLPVPVKRIGVNDEYGHSGPAADLLKQFGLCADNIAIQTKRFLKRG